MPSVFTGKPAALTLSLMLLALLSFSTNSSEPMTKRVIQIHLEMYSDRAKVQERCDAADDEQINGCSWMLGKSRYMIVTMKPKDFCDWSRMRTLGHEVMHAAGFDHSEDYLFHARGDNLSWYGENCEMHR